MKIFVAIIFILVSIGLTVIVLMQEGKDAGLGTIGGIGDTYWSKNKSRSMEGNMVKLTKWLAAIFLILAVLLSMMPDKKTSASATTTPATEAAVTSTEAETEPAVVKTTEAETEAAVVKTTEAETKAAEKTTEAKATEKTTEAASENVTEAASEK